MVFSPLFINSEVQEGLTFAKQAKLKNTNYLFSDIINVFINQEQDNNSFPTLLKTQQTELPTLDVSSLLKENNINVTELVQQNLEEIKIEINTPEASQNVASSEEKNVSLMNIISALINNSSESTNINLEKSSTPKNESAADNNAQLNLGSIKEKLENGEKILLSLNTESGEKSFIISAKVSDQNSPDSKETKNDLVINVYEINESKETLDAFIKSINAEGNDFSLVDKSANVIAQMTLLAPINNGDLNIKNLTEENPIYVFQNSDQVSGSQKPAIKLNSNNYFFNDSIKFEVKSENSTDIKIPVNDNSTTVNEMKLSLVKNGNNISANVSNSIKENISSQVPISKSGNEVDAAASEKTIASEISSAKNEIVKGKAPINIEGNGKPEQKNFPETKNLTASEKLVSQETNINKTADPNIAQVKEKQNVEIKSTITNSKNIEANIGTKEKVDQEPVSVKVKKNIKEINFIKSDSETVKTSEKEILKNVQNTSTNDKAEQKNIATNNINVVNKGLKPETTSSVSADKEIKLANPNVSENKEIINKNNIVQKENAIPKENQNVKNDLKENNTAQVKANVNEQKENPTNLSKPLPTEKPIVQAEKVLQGQKTVEPEKLVPQEKAVQTEKPVQAEKPIVQTEKVLQGQKTAEPEKLVSLEKAVQTEKPVQVEKPIIQNEKAASILKNEISDKEKPSETYDSNKAKEVVTEVKNTDAKEKSFADPKDIQSKNNVTEKAKEIITGAANSEPKFEKEASIIKEVSLKNEVSKNEKIIPNENDVAANIKSSDGNNTKNENTSKDDSNKNELYKTSDHKDVKTELRDRTETRFEKELINSKEEVARKVGNEIKSETARFNNAERIVKTSEIMKELAKHVQKQEKNTLVLQIDPENLGKMKIKLEMIENSVRAKIEVESQIVRHHIESNINDLYSQLSKNGIQLSGINISLSESDTKTNKQFSGKKKGSGQNIKDEEIDISEDIKTKSLGYNTYDYVV